LKGEPAGVHGIACPDCGALNQFNPQHLANSATPDEPYDFADDEEDDADDTTTAV